MPYRIGALVSLVLVVLLQETRWALLASRNEWPLLASAAIASLAVLVLGSGWGRGAHAADDQRALGTISNSFYEPRRQALREGGAVLGGVLGALYWGLTSWLALVSGLERERVARGLLGLQIASAVGIVAGALAGAAIGLALGEWWERAHRRRRLAAPRSGASPSSRAGVA